MTGARGVVRERFRQSRVDRRTNCWIPSGSRNTDGYVQVSLTRASTEGTPPLTEQRKIYRRVRGRQRAFTLHILSYAARIGSHPVSGEHVSHLCDVRACFNPDHLVGEDARSNNARKGCPGPIFCPEHGHLLIDLCAHTPRCIRPPREDAICCLSLRESDRRWSTPPTRTQSALSRTNQVIPPSRPTSADQAGRDRTVEWRRRDSSSPASTHYSGQSAVEEGGLSLIEEVEEELIRSPYFARR